MKFLYRSAIFIRTKYVCPFCNVPVTTFPSKSIISVLIGLFAPLNSFSMLSNISGVYLLCGFLFNLGSAPNGSFFSVHPSTPITSLSIPTIICCEPSVRSSSSSSGSGSGSTISESPGVPSAAYTALSSISFSASSKSLLSSYASSYSGSSISA